MVYESTITFTLDTICPWTYLAKLRLEKALAQVLPSSSSENAVAPVHFKISYAPYQLYPSAPFAGEDKRAWYRTHRYPGADGEERMKMYEHVMREYGRKEGVEFKFGGVVANTLPAHALIQYFQAREREGVVEKVVASLYRQYFEEERHPAEEETLVRAVREAGVGEEEVRGFLREVLDAEGDGDGVKEVKGMIREQAGNGVDSVPYIVFEGRRRDVTLVGAKEVEEYVKTLRQIIKESS